MRMKKTIILFIIYGLGFFTSQIYHSIVTHASASDQKVYTVRENGYKFIRPLLRYESERNEKDPSLVRLQSELAYYVHAQVDQGYATNISIYFRDPQAGESFTINPHEMYTPASLTKVATSMIYYKKSMIQPDILSQKLTFIGEATTAYNFPPKEVIEPGQAYTAEDLIRRSLIYSDNDAVNVLLQNISEDDFSKIYSDLQVSLPIPMRSEDYMTVRNFASFFRTIYNGTYLGAQNSEKLLATLSQSEFRDGIIAGVPPGTVVAHKFAERDNLETKVKQLHDCGIVYAPARAYILCIMTRGYSFSSLQEILKRYHQKYIVQ